jgi:ribosome-binding protein aMBF1 (putative translation factor)
MRPFCHLVIKATRWDSPPQAQDGLQLHKLLLQERLTMGIARQMLAAELGVSARTIKNWEHGWTRISSSSRRRIRSFLGADQLRIESP